MPATVQGPPCEQCGLSSSLPIVYGLPDLEASYRAYKGEIALGGCLISDTNPKRRCRECGYSYGILDFLKTLIQNREK